MSIQVCSDCLGATLVHTNKVPTVHCKVPTRPHLQLCSFAVAVHFSETYLDQPELGLGLNLAKLIVVGHFADNIDTNLSTYCSKQII